MLTSEKSAKVRIAAVYIRVSTDEQTELSPESQLQAIRGFAATNGYIIHEDYIFCDEGISGRSAKKRPEFNRMIATVKQPDHPVDCILLWKFSRFARNQEESIVYKAMLKKSGVDVVSVSEPVVEGPFGTLIERIIEWMDEYYSIRLSGEVKRSMTVNAQKGIRQTAPPFGYRLGTGDEPYMVPDEVEAPIVLECFSRYVANEPMWAIVHDLNTRGVRTHRGGAIENRTVNYWLQNPVYVGLNRWTPTGRTHRDFKNPETLVVQGTHDPIVSQELFDAAQLRIARDSAKYKPKSRPSFELKDWMSGLCRCSDCGCSLVLQSRRYFVCNGHIHAKCSTRNSITNEALHEAVIEALRADLSSSAPLQYRIVSSADGSAEELRALKTQLSGLDKRFSRIREAYTAGIDTLEEYKAYRNEIDAQRAEINAAISKLQEKQDPQKVAASLREAIETTLEKLEDATVSLEEKNDAARTLFDSCIWDKATATLRIIYRVSI